MFYPPLGFVACKNISDIKVGDECTQYNKRANKWEEPMKVLRAGLGVGLGSDNEHWYGIVCDDGEGNLHNFGTDLRYTWYSDTWYRKPA